MIIKKEEVLSNSRATFIQHELWKGNRASSAMGRKLFFQLSNDDSRVILYFIFACKLIDKRITKRGQNPNFVVERI